jgi:hypothetical protein
MKQLPENYWPPEGSTTREEALQDEQDLYETLAAAQRRREMNVWTIPATSSPAPSDR